MSTEAERAYIRHLMDELRKDFEMWAKEYQQPRDLGALGEFVSLYRKARKLKTLMWPGEDQAVGEKWRESQRTIVKEIIAHGFLLLTDLDKMEGKFGIWEEDIEEDEEDLTPQGRRAAAITREESRLRARRRGRPVIPPPSSSVTGYIKVD